MELSLYEEVYRYIISNILRKYPKIEYSFMETENNERIYVFGQDLQFSIKKISENVNKKIYRLLLEYIDTEGNKKLITKNITTTIDNIPLVYENQIYNDINKAILYDSNITTYNLEKRLETLQNEIIDLFSTYDESLGLKEEIDIKDEEDIYENINIIKEYNKAKNRYTAGRLSYNL